MKIPWNKGTKGICKANSGSFVKGMKLSEETCRRMGETRKRLGIKPPSALGRHLSKDTRKKMSDAAMGRSGLRGELSPSWKGGITPLNVKIRSSLEYKAWRRTVLRRDNYQCVIGGKPHGKKLHVDHIKPFAYFPELRFVVENGRTLCIPCHKKTDSYKKRFKKYEYR